MIIPLDTHAHIEPGIAPAELATLRSCVFAVTRTLSEYARTRERFDGSVVWGAGCHPGLAREVKGFSASRMRDAIATTPVIGEVGLDGAARTPMESQLTALRGILRAASDTPRLLSVHSYRATDLVARELRAFRPDAAILHWWMGSPAESAARTLSMASAGTPRPRHARTVAGSMASTRRAVLRTVSLRRSSSRACALRWAVSADPSVTTQSHFVPTVLNPWILEQACVRCIRDLPG